MYFRQLFNSLTLTDRLCQVISRPNCGCSALVSALVCVCGLFLCLLTHSLCLNYCCFLRVFLSFCGFPPPHLLFLLPFSCHLQRGEGLPAVHSFSGNREVTCLFISSAHLYPLTDVVRVWANLPLTESLLVIDYLLNV